MIKDLINAIVNYLTANTSYKVINSYNQTDQIDLNGVIAVTASSVENLHHGTAHDYRVSITISGQTLVSEDLTQEKIITMHDDVIDQIQNIDNLLENVAGHLLNDSNFSGDGETNNFTIIIDYFVCRD